MFNTSLLNLTNIKEIKYTKIGNSNLYSIDIKSDIIKDGEIINDYILHAEKCILDNLLQVRCEEEFSDVSIGDRFIKSVKVCTIPINVRLLTGNNGDIFKIIKNKESKTL